MKTNKLKLYYRIIGCMCLCFLTVSTAFTFYTMKKNDEKNVSYFQENVSNLKTNILNLVQSNLETLDGVSLTLGEMEVTDLEHLLPILQTINNRNSFLRMGFIHENGIGNMVDLDGTIHEDVSFSEHDFFRKAIMGKNSVSEALEDEYTGQYLNYYGVPVKIKGKTVGVLTAADETDRIRTVLDTHMFSKGGFTNIISSKGAYVIRSQYSTDIADIQELGDLTERELSEIQKDLDEGIGDFIQYTEKGEKIWAVYLPMELNDWYLLGIVPKDAVSGDYYQVIGIAAMVTSAMLIFLLLVYFINRMQSKNEKELEELAYSDTLLHMDNFVKFSMDAARFREAKEFRPFAFWYCDLDDFKFFNESFGYEAGDQLLIGLAGLFKDFLRTGESFCRETSDHYVGIRYYDEKEELINWYHTLTAKLDHYELSNHQSFRLVLSMGFYCVDAPESCLTVNEMYNRARMAQKMIKQERSVKYAFYTDDLRSQLLRENEIEAKMKTALKNHCFEVYIQPKTAIGEDNRISGGEALVRWRDEEKGMINPGEFIPLFERNGFIIPLDRYMFESVCKWMNKYLASGRRPIRLAVNVSRLGIFQEDFVDYYAEIKKKYQIPDGTIELEFTESLAVEDNDLLHRRIEELTEHGFICSLDDFGAGYSSLNTLKDLPIQVLKLDILFFRKSTDTEKAHIIISNVIRMAKQLNICVVAEGVEHPEQVEFLRQCGCDFIQGFVFGRPMPCRDFEELLNRDPRGDWGIGFHKRL